MKSKPAIDDVDKRNFVVIPQGILQKGTVSVTVNRTTGDLESDEDIFGGVLFFTQEIKDHENAKIDPSLLLSKNIKVGQVFKMNTVTLEVKSIAQNIATVAITIASDKVKAAGAAHLALSAEYWEITDVMVTGTAQLTIMGTQVNQSLTIQLRPA